jgi:hypothetical protein
VSYFLEQNPKLAVRPNYAIIKRVLMEVQSLLGGVLVEPSEERGERGGTKGRRIAFDENMAEEAEAAAEVEAVGTAAVVQ